MAKEAVATAFFFIGVQEGIHSSFSFRICFEVVFVSHGALQWRKMISGIWSGMYTNDAFCIEDLFR